MVFPWFYHMFSGYTMEIPMFFPRNSRIPRKALAPTPSTEPRLMAWPATTAGLCLGLAEESSETAPQSTPCVLSLSYIYIVIIIMIIIFITYYYYYNYLYTIIIAIIITITNNYYHWYYCCYYYHYYYYYYYICYYRCYCYRYYFYYYYSCDYCYCYWCCCCYCYYEIFIDILLKMMPYSNFFDAEIREEKWGEGLEGG